MKIRDKHSIRKAAREVASAVKTKVSPERTTHDSLIHGVELKDKRSKETPANLLDVATPTPGRAILPILWDTDIFAAIHSESIIADSGLGITRPRDASLYLSDVLANMKAGRFSDLSGAQRTFTQMAKQWQDYAQWAQRWHSANDRPERAKKELRASAGEIAERARYLKPGESFILPGGWSGAGSDDGHAMVFEIIRVPGASGFTFNVYNTGGGTNFHKWQGTPDGTRQKIQDMLSFKGVDIDAFGNGAEPSTWLLALLEPTLLGPTDLYSSYKPEEIYALFPPPGGQRVPFKEHERDGRYVSPQRASTCVWQVQLAVMRHKLSYEDYKRFKFEMRVATLLSYLAAYEKASPADHPLRQLLLDNAIENLSRSALKLIDRKVLAADQGPAVEALLRAARDRVQPSRDALAVVTPEEMAELQQQLAKHARIAVDKLPAVDALPNGSAANVRAKEPVKLGAAPAVTVPQTTDALEAQVRDAVGYVKQALNNRRHKEVVAHVDTLVDTLLRPGVKALWDAQPPLATLESLNDLMSHYLTATVRAGNDRTQDLVTAAELGMLADGLAQRCLPASVWRPFDWDSLAKLRARGGYLLDTETSRRLDRLQGLMIASGRAPVKLTDEQSKKPIRELTFDPLSNEYSALLAISRLPEISKRLAVLQTKTIQARREKAKKDATTQSKEGRFKRLSRLFGQTKPVEVDEASIRAWGDSDRVAALAVDLGKAGTMVGDARAFGLVKHMYLLAHHVASVRGNDYAADTGNAPMSVQLVAPKKAEEGATYTLAINGVQETASARRDIDKPHHNIISDTFLREAIFNPKSENDALIDARAQGRGRGASAVAYRIASLHTKPDAVSLASAVAHALSHTSDFADRDKQLHLAIVLGFRDRGASLLRQELKNNSDLASNLVALVDRGLETFVDVTPALQPARFFCWLGREMTAAFADAEVSTPPPDITRSLRDMLQREPLSPDNRAAIHTERLASLSTSAVTQSTLIDAIESLAYVNHGSKVPGFTETLSAYRAFQTALRLGPAVAEACNDPAFLQAVGLRIAPLLQSSGVAPAPDTWENAFPLLANGPWRIDVTSGAVYLHGLPYTVDMLSGLRDTEVFSSLYGDKNVSASRAGSMFVIGNDEMRVAQRDDGSYSFHKRFTLDGVEAFYANTLAEPYKLPDAFKEDHLFWRGLGAEEVTLVTDHSGTPRYVIKPTGNGRSMLDLTRRGFVNNPAFVPPNSLSRFHGYAHLLYNDQSKQAFVELPRVNLRFELTQEGRLAWDTDLSYIVTETMSPALRFFQNHIALTNSVGQKQVILPWASFSATSEKFKRSDVRQRFFEEGPKHFVVKLNPDNSLRSSDPVVNLQLAHIMLLDRQFTAAAEHLRLAADAPLSDKRVVKILMDMAELRRSLKDQDPNALAVMARASLLLSTILQGKDFDKELATLNIPVWEKNQFAKQLTKDLGAYGEAVSKVDGTLRLTLAEENAAWGLWEGVGTDPSPQMEQRKLFVSGSRRRVQGGFGTDPRGVFFYLSSQHFHNVTDPVRKRKWYQREPKPISVASLSVLHPGYSLTDVFPTLLETALGSDPKAKQDLQERLERMGVNADNESLNMRTLLFVALTFPDEAGPLLRRCTEGENRRDFSKIERLYERLPRRLRPEGISDRMRSGEGAWPAVAPVAEPKPVYQPTLASVEADRRVKRLGEPYLTQLAAANLSALPASLYPKSVADPLHEQVATIDANVKSFAEEQAMVWSLGDANKLPEIMRDLTSLADEEKVRSQAKSLVDLANHAPEDEQALARLRLETLGRIKEPITMAQMMALFAQENLGELARINPSLTPEALDNLNQQLLEHLIFRSRSQHAMRLLELGESIQTHTGDAEGREAKILDFAAMLASERTFDPVLRPAYLVFECAANVLLRPRQTQTLAALDGQDGTSVEALVQLNMGEGKTKVLLPLLALQNANGQDLAMVVVPPSLLQVNRRDLQQTTGDMFSQFGQVFDFKRGDQTNLDRLQFLRESLQAARRERRYVVTTRGSIAALRLQHRELLLNAAAGNGGASDMSRIAVMGEMLTLMREHGNVLVDEADQALDVRAQVNFSTGAAASINPAHTALVTQIYEALTTLPRARALANLKENQQSLVNETQYAELAQLVAQYVLDNHPTLRALPAQTTLFDYITGRVSELPDSLSAALGMSGVNAMPTEAANLLALLREEITQILPLTLKRNGGEHYGRSQKTQAPFAIPYLRSQPLETSQFGHHYEATNYTIQTYLQAKPPIVWTEIRDVLQEVQRRVAAEVLQNKCKWNETDAAAKFAQLVAGTSYVTQTLPQVLSDEASMRAIAGIIQGELPRLFAYLQNFVLPYIEVFPLQISSDSRDFKNSFARMQAWTGTPWDHPTYPSSLKRILSNQTDGVTANALFNPNKTETVSVTTASVRSILDKVENTRSGKDNTHALIDAGALFKGVPNAQVARDLAGYWRQKHGVGFKGILYFDDETKRLALLRLGETEPVVLSGTDPSVLRDMGLQPEQLFTYYDQSHTFGADIPQPPRSTGILTVGELTLLRDMQQGLLRMRQIAKQQRCVLAVPASLTASLGSDSAATLYKHCLVNQTRQLGSNKVAAIRQEFTGRAQAMILDWCASSSPRSAVRLARIARDLISTEVTDAPFEQFGQSGTEKTRKVLDAFTVSLRRSISGAAAQMFDSDFRPLQRSLMEYAEQLADPSYLDGIIEAIGTLPEKTRSMGASGRDGDQMVEPEMQQQVAKEVEQYIYVPPADPRSWMELNPYDETWLNKGMDPSQKTAYDFVDGDALEQLIQVDWELMQASSARNQSSWENNLLRRQDMLIKAGVPASLATAPVDPANPYAPAPSDDGDDNIDSDGIVVRSSDLPTGSLFDPNIWMTHNVLVSTYMQNRDVLTPHQKPVHYILAVQDTDAKGKTTVRAVFGAKEDARFLYRQLGNAKLAAGSKRKLTLCDEHGIKLLAGVHPVDDAVLEGDVFQEYLAQAKAMSRPYTDELALSRIQRTLLDKWLVRGTERERDQKRAMMGR